MPVVAGLPIDAAELRAMASRSKSAIVPHHLEAIADGDRSARALRVPGNLVIEGDLDFEDDDIQVLVVDGDLIVEGRLTDRQDEENESLIFVGGNLRAQNLISFGTLEVHGDVIVEQHVVLRDNACMTHIEGDLRANFVINEYHHCEVVGSVKATTIVQDSPGRIEASQVFNSFGFDGEIATILVRDVLDAQDDESSPGRFSIEWVDLDAVVERISAGLPVLAGERS